MIGIIITEPSSDVRIYKTNNSQELIIAKTQTVNDHFRYLHCTWVLMVSKYVVIKQRISTYGKYSDVYNKIQLWTFWWWIRLGLFISGGLAVNIKIMIKVNTISMSKTLYFLPHIVLVLYFVLYCIVLRAQLIIFEGKDVFHTELQHTNIHTR